MSDSYTGPGAGVPVFECIAAEVRPVGHLAYGVGIALPYAAERGTKGAAEDVADWLRGKL